MYYIRKYNILFQFLQNSKKKQEEELASLQKEAVAMTILKHNYDQILLAHNSAQPGNSTRHVTDQVKFQVVSKVHCKDLNK